MVRGRVRNAQSRSGASRRRRSGHRYGFRLLAVVGAAALVAAGCGRDDSTAIVDDETTVPSGAPTTAPSGAAAGEFGDLGPVCGPAAEGATLEASDAGVTADSIQIGTIADPGFPGRPGLNQEIFDSAEAFTKWCNEAGGIKGRKIVLKKRDAKLTEYQTRMIEACDQGDFMLVGGGGVFDDQGQRERLSCGLPNIAAFVTNPQALDADLVVAPVPNDSHTLPVGDMRWLSEQFPEATKKVGVLVAGVAVTMTVAERTKEAMKELGWEVVYEEKYNAAGEASWRGYAEGLKSSGARALIWVADPGNLAGVLKALAEIEYRPDFVRGVSNIYDPLLLAEAGRAADNIFIQGTHYPFLDEELAAENPATKQYLEIIDEYDPGGKVANLGVTGFSAWLLFAQAASQCGPELTRDCVWEHASQIEQWTGGGLHARQDLASGRSSRCFVGIEASDGQFRIVDVGANEGIYHCADENVVDLEGDYGEGVKCENPAFADDPKPSHCAP